MFTQFAIAYSALATATASVCSRLFGFVLLFLLALDLQRMICYFLFLLLPILLLLFVREEHKIKAKYFSISFNFFFSLSKFLSFLCAMPLPVVFIWQIPFTHYLTALQIRFRFCQVNVLFYSTLFSLWFHILPLNDGRWNSINFIIYTLGRSSGSGMENKTKTQLRLLL